MGLRDLVSWQPSVSSMVKTVCMVLARSTEKECGVGDVGLDWERERKGSRDVR